MVLKISPFEFMRAADLGIAFIMTVPTSVFFIDFIHGHSLHGRALVFKILGLLVGPLSLVALPSMIILYRLERFPGFSVVSEILFVAILFGLWLAFFIVGNILQGQLYPVPEDYQNQKVSGCQFLPPGPEVHRCHSLALSSALPSGIFSVLFSYCTTVLISSIIAHVRGRPIWMQPIKSAFPLWKWNCGPRGNKAGKGLEEGL